MSDGWPALPAAQRAQQSAHLFGRLFSDPETVDRRDIAELFSVGFLDGLPPEALLSELRAVAGQLGPLSLVEVEISTAHHFRGLVETADGARFRYHVLVEPDPPHSISGWLLSDLLPPSDWNDRVVEGAEARVFVRDYGGDGPPILLLHGGGADVSTWTGLRPDCRDESPRLICLATASEEQIARRNRLAAWLEERGHLDIEWLAAGHLLVASHPEETAGFINNLAARATRLTN